MGEDQLADALKGADIVIIPAGGPRKPGMTRDDLFNVSECGLLARLQTPAGWLLTAWCVAQINAGIVKGLLEAVAKHSPDVRSLPFLRYPIV